MLIRFEVICCCCCCCCAVLSLSVATLLSDDHRRQQGLHSTAAESEGSSSAMSSSSSSSSSYRRSFRRSASEEADERRQSTVNSSTSYGNCSRYEAREAKRSYRLETVKTKLLQKLGLSVPPNVTGRQLPGIPQLHKIISDHRRQSSDSNDNGTWGLPPDGGIDDTFASTNKYVLFAQPAPSAVAGNATDVFHFQFQSEMSHQQIVNASINIFVRRSTTPGLDATWMLLYQLNRLPANSGESQERETMRRRRIRMDSLRNSGQWITFDIKTYVERWILQPLQFGIVVQMSDGRGEPLAIVHPQSPEERDQKPYLVVHVKDQAAARPRRTTDGDCDEISAERRCCRYPLVIDFEQFHWDWIIVPKRYSAYYCSGECPFLYSQRYAHTGLAQQTGTAGGPCCAPRKVSAISMLYYDNHMNIVYGRLPGMVVDQCGCS